MLGSSLLLFDKRECCILTLGSIVGNVEARGSSRKTTVEVLESLESTDMLLVDPDGPHAQMGRNTPHPLLVHVLPTNFDQEPAQKGGLCDTGINRPQLCALSRIYRWRTASTPSSAELAVLAAVQVSHTHVQDTRRSFAPRVGNYARVQRL